MGRYAGYVINSPAAENTSAAELTTVQEGHWTIVMAGDPCTEKATRQTASVRTLTDSVGKFELPLLRNYPRTRSSNGKCPTESSDFQDPAAETSMT